MAQATDAHTPMMQQYWEIKSQYPDKLLFYRLGFMNSSMMMLKKQLATQHHINATRRIQGRGNPYGGCAIPCK